MASRKVGTVRPAGKGLEIDRVGGGLGAGCWLLERWADGEGREAMLYETIQ